MNDELFHNAWVGLKHEIEWSKVHLIIGEVISVV